MEGEVVDPYVKVKIIGHPVDKQKYQTHSIHDNGKCVILKKKLNKLTKEKLNELKKFQHFLAGFNPQWNCKFTLEVELPELALIYLIVKDQNSTGVDRTLGSWAQPFTSLAQGKQHKWCIAKN